jgi:hypothetical protein
MRSRSHVVAAAGVAVILGALLAASPAVAQCDPDNAVFEDEFEFMDPSWGDPDDNFYVEDGALLIKSQREQVNFSTKNQGANVCVDATIVDAPAPDNSPIGLIFWWQDWDNYYFLLNWSNGGSEIRRVVKGKEESLFSLDTLALKKGVGQTNSIELRLRPKDATVLFNGTEVKRFKGKQPQDGGVVGVIGLSSEDKPATFKFDNFVVSPPPG